jgi:hypothetical protein
MTIALNHTLVLARRHVSLRNFSGSALRLQRELSSSSSVSIDARRTHVYHSALHARYAPLPPLHAPTAKIIAALAQACSVCARMRWGLRQKDPETFDSESNASAGQSIVSI